MQIHKVAKRTNNVQCYKNANKHSPVSLCINCDDLMSMYTVAGEIRKVFCRGSGIDGFNRKDPNERTA
jgi:hypothetical protein